MPYDYSEEELKAMMNASMPIKDRIEQAVQNPRNSESVRELLRDVLADRERLEADANLWNEWLPWLSTLSRMPFNLAKEIARREKTAAIAQQDKKE